MMRWAGTRTLSTGSRVEESWCTSFLVGVPRSQVPGSVSSRMIMQVPLRRLSSDSTAAVTTLANPMFVVHQLLGGRAAIPGAGVSVFQDDHAGALETLIV